jgi:hypothetical protein
MVGGPLYINFAGFGDETDDLSHALHGPNQERLDRIRRTYDPAGLFDTAAYRP